MRERELTQGTVIYGVRSKKYPTGPCYGIIITARCDIAQDKVPKYYYLLAVDASKWFCTQYGYRQAYAGTLKSRKTNLCNKAAELELDGESLITMDRESVTAILADKRDQVRGIRKEEQKVDSLAKIIEQYCDMANVTMDTSRSQVIKQEHKTAVNFLKEIDSGKQCHYYFLPQDAYLNNGVMDRGLIVDMLEIGVLSKADAKKIVNPFVIGLTYSDLPQLPSNEELHQLELNRTLFEKISEYVRLRQEFWLESGSDFVAIDGTTRSPWCEHMMQRFSNVFIRIGLDNPTNDDFVGVIKHCFEENNNL